MEELLNLLEEMVQVTRRQAQLFEDLLPLLAEEEDSIARYHLSDLQRIVAQKHRHIQLAQMAEENREKLLKKICYFIAFDSRGQPLTLETFQSVLQVYIQNVTPLIPTHIKESLVQIALQLKEKGELLKAAVQKARPLVRQNQQILTKLNKNLQGSLSLLQAYTTTGLSYDALGKGHSSLDKSISLVQVQV